MESLGLTDCVLALALTPDWKFLALASEAVLDFGLERETMIESGMYFFSECGTFAVDIAPHANPR